MRIVKSGVGVIILRRSMIIDDSVLSSLVGISCVDDEFTWSGSVCMEMFDIFGAFGSGSYKFGRMFNGIDEIASDILLSESFLVCDKSHGCGDCTDFDSL